MPDEKSTAAERHEAGQSALSAMVRRILVDQYDGFPPYLSPIPASAWERAEKEAARQMETTGHA